MAAARPRCAKAAERLLEASDVAAGYIVQVIKDESLLADMGLRAATDLLNRAGLSGEE